MEGFQRNRVTNLAEAVEPWVPPDPHRLLGEDAPIWLAAGFAVIGTLIAVASASTWLTAPPAPAIAHRTALPATAVRAERERAEIAQLQPPASVQNVPAIQAPAAEIAAPAAEPAQIARLEPPAPAICFTAFNIPFAHDSALPIIKGAEPSIEELRRWMMEHPEAVLMIEGHTDTIGPEQHNVLLSFSRAKSVASLLSRLGVPERRITIRAAGSIAAAEKTGKSAGNRRASLRIEGVENCSRGDGETERQ